jgi:drug/metabolite transporter (DMT)-like permease
LGAIFVAAYFLVGRVLRRTVSTLTYTFWVYGTAAGVLLFLALVTRTPLGPYGPGDWLIFAGLALVCTLLGHSVFNWALAYLPATSVTVAILGEPIGAGLLALLLFHEAPRLGQLLAGAVLLSGIAVYLSAPVPAATPPPQGVNHFNAKAS